MNIELFETFETFGAILIIVLFVGTLAMAVVNVFREGVIMRFVGIVVIATLILLVAITAFIGDPLFPTEKSFLQNFDLSQVKIKGDQQFDVGATMIFKDGRFLKIVPNQPEKK